MDTKLTVGLVVRPFKLDRGHEPQGGMTADAVVEHFQVPEELGPGLLPGGADLARAALALPPPEERVRGGVVPALADLAHTAHDPLGRQPPLVVVAGVLTP